MLSLKALAVLMACSSAYGIHLRIAPSFRWTVWGSSYLSGVESVSYEYGETRVLFPNAAQRSFGLGIDGRLTGCIDANIGGYWNNYVPASVTPPDSGSHSMNRDGNLIMIELVARRRFGAFFLGSGIELHHYRETWCDPFTGTEQSVNSTCIGPKVEVGTVIATPLGDLKVSMATIFPGFEDITGSAGVSLLIP